ncbi:MAG: Light-harvesting alpha subunit / Histone protein [Myxococcaceae bacterium]|nr:Light-harvesting alpha subunit / Histone protein [Myxococcaceae bacterium]
MAARVGRPGVTVTEFRGTEQELWDEDATSDDEDKTLVIAPRAGHLRGQVPVGAPPPTPSVSPKTGSPQGFSVDTVARFIADASPLRPSADRELDAPRRSLAALELLDADEGAEPTEVRALPVPPALPAAAKPLSGEPTSIVLGSPGSMRSDVTERVTTIPRTHPMANSIAPGGSPLSVPPGRRRSLRWQAALGVAALLAIGGFSRLLQSRGEHHAASGARGENAADGDEQGSSAEPRRVAPAPSPVADNAQGSAARAREVSAAVPASSAASEPPEAPAATPESVRASGPSATRAEGAEAAKKEHAAQARRLRIGVGGAQLLERSPAAVGEPGASEPDRGAIVSALSALTPQLRECVGDQHGIADVTLTVRAPGVVAHALVEGSYAGSAQGSCIAKTLRSAKLPRFAEPVSRVEYPFQL